MSKTAFATGAISQLFLVISAFSSMTLGDFTTTISSMGCWSGRTLFPNSFLLFGAYASSLLLVSALLVLVSLVAMARHLRVNWISALGPVLLLFAAAIELLLFTTGFRPSSYYSTGYGVFYAANQGIDILASSGYVLASSAMIAVGAFFMKYRDRFSNPNLWTATGVTYLTSGLCALVLFMHIPTVIWLLIAFCGVMGTGCFLLSRSGRE